MEFLYFKYPAIFEECSKQSFPSPNGVLIFQIERIKNIVVSMCFFRLLMEFLYFKCINLLSNEEKKVFPSPNGVLIFQIQTCYK